MGRTVLIPTDFRSDAIDRLKVVLQSLDEHSLNVILFHGIYSSDSISELLFFDETDFKTAIAGRDFLNEIQELERELNPKVEFIRLVLFSGLTQSSFDSFLESNGVEQIIIPTGRALDCSHKKSRDILPFLQNSKVSKRLIALEIQSFLNPSFQIKTA